MDNTAIQGTVGLVLNKFDELIRAVGGKVETFYPYVVKQQMINAITVIVVLIVGLILIVGSLFTFNEKNWENEAPKNGIAILGLIFVILGGVLFMVSLANFCSAGALFNPDYYAVRDILVLGKSLIR